MAIDNMALRYTGNMHTIAWMDILDMELPITSNHKKTLILHLCGQYAISPLWLLSRVILEHNDIAKCVIQNDEEFRISLRSFANNLSRCDQDFQSNSVKTSTSSTEYCLEKVLSHDDEIMEEFLSICHDIMKRYDISAKTASPNQMSRKRPFNSLMYYHSTVRLVFDNFQGI